MCSMAIHFSLLEYFHTLLEFLESTLTTKTYFLLITLVLEIHFPVHFLCKHFRYTWSKSFMSTEMYEVYTHKLPYMVSQVKSCRGKLICNDISLMPTILCCVWIPEKDQSVSPLVSNHVKLWNNIILPQAEAWVCHGLEVCLDKFHL